MCKRQRQSDLTALSWPWDLWSPGEGLGVGSCHLSTWYWLLEKAGQARQHLTACWEQSYMGLGHMVLVIWKSVFQRLKCLLFAWPLFQSGSYPDGGATWKAHSQTQGSQGLWDAPLLALEPGASKAWFYLLGLEALCACGVHWNVLSEFLAKVPTLHAWNITCVLDNPIAQET